MFALSLPNSALRFSREGAGFSASYNISLTFVRDSVVVKRVVRKEPVHIATFAETGRTDESVIFQEAVTLAPGRYTVILAAGDANSTRALRARESLEVPAYGPDLRLGSPVLVYTGSGRQTVSERPAVVVNPRKTVSYGAEVPQVYIELYNAGSPQVVQLRVLDQRGTTVWQSQPEIANGDGRLRHATITVPLDSLPLGRLWLEATTAGSSAEIHRSPLLVTISDQWMVANFDDVLGFITQIAYPAELDSLRTATGAERRLRWDRFWARRDPLPATPINEYREEFFQRVRFATENFAEADRPGWDTHRGRVYIVLGAPSREGVQPALRENITELGGLEWLYDGLPWGRLRLYFIDRTGVGHYQLTPESESDFRSISQRMKPKGTPKART